MYVVSQYDTKLRSYALLHEHGRGKRLNVLEERGGKDGWVEMSILTEGLRQLLYYSFR